MKLKIKPNEMKLLFLLLIILGGIHFKNKYYLPKKNLISVHKMTLFSLKQNLIDMETNAPLVQKKEQEVKDIEKEINRIDVQFKKIGSEIPKMSELDRFLHYLTLEKPTKGIEFVSITPLKAKNNERQNKNQENEKILSGYITNKYNLKIKGNFSDILNYADYLENLTHFVMIKNCEISQNIENRANILQASIIFTIMISESSDKDSRTSFTVQSDITSRKVKSPFQFFEAIRKKEEETKGDEEKLPSFKLTGIVSVGKEFRVIIDKQFYKNGDKVNKSIIKKIYKNKVMFQTGGIDHDISL